MLIDEAGQKEGGENEWNEENEHRNKFFWRATKVDEANDEMESNDDDASSLIISILLVLLKTTQEWKMAIIGNRCSEVLLKMEMKYS